ncbi:MAG: 16S rRNA (cytosine(1402)-N(4))-methyltransferase [Gammaproteobacteria bacterium]|nr:MAG: 16S rRNA (cytosine(1402)-N(4))-methyltransferase [Gammaproteobacteria bacterium]
MTQQHIPVLLQEAITALQISPEGYYFDGTFGRGGHSRAILEQLGPTGRLYATDRDPRAAEVAATIADSRFAFARGEFSHFMDYFPELGKESLDGILLDLGVSSPQLDEAERGFSFSREGELDMRMNPDTKLTAKQFVNHAEYGELVNVIACLGEERFAKPIAKHIIRRRSTETIKTTTQLADIVSSAVPARFHVPGRHPATRTFQAIRIHVNRELDELQDVLDKAYSVLKKGGRLVIISFHSLEDNRVKRYVKSMAGDELPPEIPVADNAMFKKMKLLGRPIRPSETEITHNPRARSSLMRVIEKQ